MFRRLFFTAMLTIIMPVSTGCTQEEPPFKMRGVAWHMEQVAGGEVLHLIKTDEEDPEYYHALMCEKDDWVYAASFRYDGKKLNFSHRNRLEFQCGEGAWKIERERRANLAIRKLLDDPDGYTPYQVLAKIEDILR